MKKQEKFGSILFLVAAAVAAVWLNLPKDKGMPQSDISNGNYILAVSWQPAFCESRPNLPECRSQRKERFDATNLSLHGLWPQPKDNLYCGVSMDLVSLDKSRRWMKLPKLELSDAVRQELSEKMPGYRSGLHRHEWIKHGTCMPGGNPELYFSISLKLLDGLNKSELAKLLRQNLSSQLQYRELDRAISKSFGPNAGLHMVVDCYRDDGRRIISEIKLSLAGDLNDAVDLQSLITNGQKLGSSCPSGIVDPVGLQ